MSTALLLSLAAALGNLAPGGDHADFGPASAAEPAPPRSTSIGYLPRGLTSFGAAVDDGWLYVLGGYFGTPHEYSIEGQSGAFIKINLLDPRDTRLLGDVEPVQGAELVRWGDRLIRVGGLHARNRSAEPAQLESSDEVSWYDVHAASWTKLAPLPAPRSSHRAVVLGDELHVLGGWCLSGASRGAEWATEHLVLDLAQPEAGWKVREAPVVARAAAAAVSAGRIYLIGGIREDRSVSSDCWVYDAASSAWERGPDFPDWGFGVSATEAHGGIVASGKSGRVHGLDASLDEWTARGELAHGRIFHELRGASGDAVIALGGIAGMEVRGRVRSIERLELASATPQAVTVEPRDVAFERTVLPAPCSAKNRFGLHVEGRSLYFFGGNTSLGQHDFEPENFSAESWRLDLGNLEWTRLADLPRGRQTMQVAAAAVSTDPSAPSGPLVVAGFGHSGEAAVTQGSSWRYDVEFDEWHEGPALGGTRSQFGLARHGEQLWIFGGLDYDPARSGAEAFDHRRDALVLDEQSSEFLPSGVETPGERRAFAGARSGDHYYMVGGMASGFQRVESAVRFDFETRAWSEIPAPAFTRVGADLVPLGGALYLVGGSSPKASGKGLESNPSIERFDPETLEWSTVVEDVGMELKHARAFALGDTLLIVSMHRAGVPRLEMLTIPQGRLQVQPRQL